MQPTKGLILEAERLSNVNLTMSSPPDLQLLAPDLTMSSPPDSQLLGWRQHSQLTVTL